MCPEIKTFTKKEKQIRNLNFKVIVYKVKSSRFFVVFFAMELRFKRGVTLKREIHFYFHS